MKKLVFFDINGTIIKRDSRTDLPFSIAADNFLNKKDCMNGINTSARSDKDVLMEVLLNIGQEFSEELWGGFLEEYKKQLESFKESDVWRENADAKMFIQKLHGKGYLLSLISGELSIGAEYKLKKLGVWEYFQTGAFGEDGLKRFDIADAALKKAKEKWGDDFDEIIVIGDTILDIKTAQHLGGKVVSIATGSNSREELEKEQPDYLVDQFCELDNVEL